MAARRAGLKAHARDMAPLLRELRGAGKNSICGCNRIDCNGHSCASRRRKWSSKSIERLFDVKVTAVNTLLRKGKNKAFRGIRGRQQDMKKAIVTLADGHRIDMTTGL